MKLGIIAYGTRTGLGYQTKAYYKHLNPDKVLAVDLSKHNGVKVFKSWYAKEKTIWTDGYPKNDEVEEFLKGLDVVFYAETPLNYYLHERARHYGVKVVQAYNYEFLDYFRNILLPPPTLFAAPTVWNVDTVKGMNFAPVKHWPVPVDRDRFPFTHRSKAETIIHIIGRPAVYDRNGTLSFLKLIRNLEQAGHTELNYKIYMQKPKESRTIEYFAQVQNELNQVKAQFPNKVEVITNTKRNIDLYKEGDLLVLPRRYGGLCLPMQEALSCGLPVIMTDVSPNDAILPPRWLAQSKQVSTFRGHAEIPVWEANEDSLLEVVCGVMRNIQNESLTANGIAEGFSWSNLKEKYFQWFSEL